MLHAAVLGGPAAVPAMPLLAADGVAIDSQLDFGQGAAPLEAFLQSFGVRFWYRQQATPLALACRCERVLGFSHDAQGSCRAV